MYLSTILQTIHKSADDLVVLDPYGTGLTIISVTIVFVVLTALYLVFRSIGKVFQKDFKLKRQKNKPQKPEIQLQNNDDEPSGEVCAAIAMALYYYNTENHDYENSILTIKKNINTYSPWNSKIHGLRKTIK